MGLTEINCGIHKAHVGENVLSMLQSHLEIASPPISTCVIICDTNTYEHCLPILLDKVPYLNGVDVLEIPPGEQSKNIHAATNLWSKLVDHALDRDSMVINLGGGVVSDLGGFVAATYKRGVRYINLPTSLLGMVDAAIGGKTGVDLDQVKNMVGAFAPPERVYIHVPFLRTLPKRHMLNGLAEMMKHALIKDEEHWHQLKKAPLHDPSAMAAYVFHSAGLKAQVVMEDPHEKGVRKILNFGHTIGHAIETLALEGVRKDMLHGEAVAAGMICETFISYKRGAISEKTLDDIVKTLSSSFPAFPLEKQDDIRIIELIRNDKKNHHDEFRFTLLEAIGQASTDQTVSIEQVNESLEYYRQNIA
jgi:3-dehydroquinate synthase